jgi:hypothetical protein
MLATNRPPLGDPKSIAGPADIDDRADDEDMADSDTEADGELSDTNRLTELLSGPILAVAPAPCEPPPSFEHHVYEHEWTIRCSRAAVWEWVCDPATFTDGQIPPFRVEFLPDAAGGPASPSASVTHTSGRWCHSPGCSARSSTSGIATSSTSTGALHSATLLGPTRLQFWLLDGPSDRSCAATPA